MGLWTKLAGIGTGIAGVVTGNPALIAAGAGIIGSDVAADGSKQAQATQEAASKEAMAVNTRAYDDTRGIQSGVYNTTRNDLAPYMGVGAQSMGTLGSMVGQPPLPPTDASGKATKTATSGTTEGASLGSMVSPSATQGLPAAGDGGTAPQARAAMRTQSAYAPGEKRGNTLGRTAGLVRLRAPDGEMRFVPQGQAAQFLEAGAVEV